MSSTATPMVNTSQRVGIFVDVQNMFYSAKLLHQSKVDYGRLLREITGKKAIERARKGAGFDYWIGDTDDDELIFSKKARLEVSGILSGTDSNIAARLRTKLDQVKPSDMSGFPAYIAIIEFGQPKARVELK